VPARRLERSRRRPRREEPWTPLWLRRLLGPKRRYAKRFRRYLAVAIGIASAGAALAAWRGEEHARVAEEHDRAAFAQRIALEQQRAEIRVSQLLDIVSAYARMKAAAFQARALDAQRASASPDDADRLRAEAAAQRHLQYDILDRSRRTPSRREAS
jgi:hypothetical protein